MSERHPHQENPNTPVSYIKSVINTCQRYLLLQRGKKDFSGELMELQFAAPRDTVAFREAPHKCFAQYRSWIQSPGATTAIFNI